MRHKKALTLGLAAILTSSAFMNSTYAANLTKNIKAVYRDIKINYNGQFQTLDQEPFLIDGSVYVPLRAISQMTGDSVSWANNTVTIQKNNSTSNHYEQLLSQKNFELANTKNQLEVANKEIEKLKNELKNQEAESNKETDYDATVKQLEKDFGDEYGVQWYFDLDENKNGLELIISFDSKYDGKYFDRISSSKLEGFVEDILEEVSEAYPKLDIYGEVYDEYQKDTLSEFEYTSKGKFSYKEVKNSLSFKDMEKELLKDYKSLDGIKDGSSESYDFSIEDIVLSERRGTLTFTVVIDLGDKDVNWSKLNNTSKRNVESLMEDIADDLADEYGKTYDYIDGLIEDEDGNMIVDYDGEEVNFK